MFLLDFFASKKKKQAIQPLLTKEEQQQQQQQHQQTHPPPPPLFIEEPITEADEFCIEINPRHLPCPEEELGELLTDEGVSFLNYNEKTNMCGVELPKKWGLIAEWARDTKQEVEKVYYLVDYKGKVWAVCKLTNYCTGEMIYPGEVTSVNIKKYRYGKGWYYFRDSDPQSFLSMGKKKSVSSIRVRRRKILKRKARQNKSAPVSGILSSAASCTLSSDPSLWRTYENLPESGSI